MFTNQAISKEGVVRIVVDKEKCINCHKCLDACPLVRVFGFKSLKDEFAGNICIECGACMAICPQSAITINDLGPAQSVQTMPSSEEVLNLIRRRRSIRAFKKQKVRQEDWEQLLEAVKYAPTGHNAQYIDIMIIESPEVLKKISKAGMDLCKKFSSHLTKPILSMIYKRILGEHTFLVFSKTALFYKQQKEAFDQGEDPILFHAPALMLFLAPKSEFMSKNDADLAAQTVALYAPTLGLGTCYSGVAMAAFSGLVPSIKKAVSIPKGNKVFNALIVGYEKHEYRYIPPRKDRNIYYV
jgi:nitroreductase/NAD-dependent dihydropyrimidine dehydrogenase PreA subunit